MKGSGSPRGDVPARRDASDADSGEVQPGVAGIVVAAGRGTRYGATDKVLSPLDGRSILAWVVDAFTTSCVREIVIVAGPHTWVAVSELVHRLRSGTPIRIVTGGERRQDSVARGVAAVSAGIDLVVIHDAARPMVTAMLIDRTVDQARETGAAIAACPVTDTLKRVRVDLTIEATIPRDALWAAQTPQAFRRDPLTEAFKSTAFQQQTFTDEAALFEELGYPVAVVPNHEPNPKVTHPGDLAVIEALLAVSRDREPAR